MINNENFSYLILLFYFILIDFHAIPEFFLVKWIVLERIQCLGGGYILIFKCYVQLYFHAFFHYLMKFPVFCK